MSKMLRGHCFAQIKGKGYRKISKTPNVGSIAHRLKYTARVWPTEKEPSTAVAGYLSR